LKIVLITTTQPTVNPRLVKEADALTNFGHEVIVLYCFTSDWAQKEDKKLLTNKKWSYKQIGGTNKKDFIYQSSRIRYNVYKKLNIFFGVKMFAEQAHARCYNGLLNAAVKLEADFYIGHNPGAMAIAANAAKKTNTKSGFDFEDYHRGEFSNTNHIAYKRQVFLEQKYIHTLNTITVASTIIKKQIEKDFFELPLSIVTILNTFPLSEQPVFNNITSNKLRLFWFSQYIGKDRGIELLIDSIRDLDDKSISLTLVGNYTDEIKTYLLNLAGNCAGLISFAGIISAAHLPEFASNFDIGLAIEKNEPLNRDLCLTNKIFTYLLAGNAIISSETKMQKVFNDEYKVGKSFPLDDLVKLKECIIFYKNRENLLLQKKYNYELAKNELNWENESKKLIELFN
jgi:glycosyltransferase involved in cell wall biosynthesis